MYLRFQRRRTTRGSVFVIVLDFSLLGISLRRCTTEKLILSSYKLVMITWSRITASIVVQRQILDIGRLSWSYKTIMTRRGRNISK